MPTQKPQQILPHRDPAVSKSNSKSQDISPNSKPDSKPKASAKPKKSKKSRLTPGARNLILLGIGATLIATVTTTFGLAIYHLSGDIYLDRSRPGYLPDEAEAVEEAEAEPEEFTFDKSGKIDRETLEEYLKHLSEELNAVDSYKDPFADAPLSDDRLGIPKTEQ